ncbi:4'-phosphopantetheinyl transferase superfamily protein [Streptomyces sp. 891-h]|nr:4'-phosphopantetheinyl transferase superfamily protein [Streptomyces sp. 891-h]
MADLPPPGEVVVRLLRIGSSTAAADSRILDEEERRRAAGFQDPAARERFRVSHIGLRTLLGARLGVRPQDVTLTREPCGVPGCGRPHGRPAVAGATGLEFSMSHAGDVVLYALAGAAVGVDVEAEEIARDGVERRARRLHPQERAELAALPAERRARALLGCWVRKEAYFKGLGTGLAAGTRRHYVGLAVRDADRPGRPEDGTGSAHTGPGGWGLAEVPVPAGYRAAVALRTARPGPPTVRAAPLRLG